MGLDNPHTPTRADCNEPTCPKRLTIPPGHTRRQAERELVGNGWTWEVEYDTVHAYCPDHSTEPARKTRGSRR
jgi:hypothetical protein